MVCEQAIGEMHKILGQVALLGTPIAFGSNILAGLASFFAEPAKARNPEEFVRGVLRGSGILLKYATFGFFNAFSQVHFLDRAMLYSVLASCMADPCIHASENRSNPWLG